MTIISDSTSHDLASWWKGNYRNKGKRQSPKARFPCHKSYKVPFYFFEDQKKRLTKVFKRISSTRNVRLKKESSSLLKPNKTFLKHRKVYWRKGNVPPRLGFLCRRVKEEKEEMFKRRTYGVFVVECGCFTKAFKRRTRGTNKAGQAEGEQLG